MYLLQDQGLDEGERGTAAYEDVAEVRAAGFGSSSAPPSHPRSQFFFLRIFFLFWLLSLFTAPSRTSPFACLFFQSCLSFLPSRFFYPLSFFIVLD